MKTNRKDSCSSLLGRVSSRHSPKALDVTNAECWRKVSSASRNAWIAQAAVERLAPLPSASRPQGAEEVNG